VRESIMEKLSFLSLGIGVATCIKYGVASTVRPSEVGLHKTVGSRSLTSWTAHPTPLREENSPSSQKRKRLSSRGN
jgi:hypothetical protein